MPPHRVTHHAAAAAIILTAIAPQACTYRREVSRSGMIRDLADAQNGSLSKKRPKPGAAQLNPVFAVPNEGIRVEDDDGNITLYTKRITHLMTHIMKTIENDEPELFVEQVLSERTIREFEERGLEPALAHEELTRRRKDIYKLFAAMPMGEATPGMYLKPLDKNLFRLEVPKARRAKLNWIGIDASFEQGNFKLRWFVSR